MKDFSENHENLCLCMMWQMAKSYILSN